MPGARCQALMDKVVLRMDDLQPQFEHFGSTAILGIATKPIIDIMLILPPEAGWSVSSHRLSR
ncbi:MAG: hypothetical protein BRC41_01885 [Cyanobacteria bacterium QH_9_48_43]|nr:MAG: hypothetical protein BRC41_01885 [Cyanobacteria bacterium QH_9_48_43]